MNFHIELPKKSALFENIFPFFWGPLNPSKGDVRKTLPGINSNTFDPFLENLFHGSPKKWQKLKLY